MGAANAAGLDILSRILLLLALSNFLIAVFNLFPGYPLDGGRVLRAYLWKQGKDLTEATLLTGRCGKLIAYGLIALGVLFIILYGEFFIGFWAILVGLFLYDSARVIIRDIENARAKHIDDVMMLPVPVDPDSSVLQFVDHVLPGHRNLVFPVARDRQLFGLLVIEDLSASLEPSGTRL